MDVLHNVISAYTYDFCVGIHKPTGCVSGEKKKLRIEEKKNLYTPPRGV